MGLFLATHINKVDQKGRLSVPAPFRAALPASHAQTIVLVPSFRHDAIEGFSLEKFEQISSRMDHFDLFSDEQDDLATTLFAAAMPLTFDDTGRMTLPDTLAEHAGITDRAAFIGLGEKVQSWNPETLDARRSKALSNIKKKKLTLPATGGSERERT